MALNQSLLLLQDSLQFLAKVGEHVGNTPDARDLPNLLKILGGSVVRIMINPRLLPKPEK